MLVSLSDETPAGRVRRLRRQGMTEADAVTATALHFGIGVTWETDGGDPKVIEWRLVDVNRLLFVQWMRATGRISDDMADDPEMHLPGARHSDKVWTSHPWRTFRPPV